MPSKTDKQRRFMQAVAHNKEFAKKVGVPVSVGKEFVAADKGRKLREGGEMAESKKMMKKEVAFMKSKGAPKSMIAHEEKETKGMMKGGKCYAAGGYTRAADGIAKKGKTKGTKIVMKGSK